MSELFLPPTVNHRTANMFQLLVSLFRLFKITSISPTNNHCCLCRFFHWVGTIVISVPLCHRKETNIVPSVCCVVQPDKPRLPLQTRYHLPLLSAGHLLQLLPLYQISVTVSPIGRSRPWHRSLVFAMCTILQQTEAHSYRRIQEEAAVMSAQKGGKKSGHVMKFQLKTLSAMPLTPR